MSNALEFELIEPDHVYKLKGKRIPGTTEMLNSCGIIDSRWFNEEAAKRGKEVHEACHFLAEGDLDMDSIRPGIRGYVDAYEAAVEELNFFPTECERAIYHPIYLYGTKPDQVGFVRKNGKDQDAIVELKSGIMQPWTRLQTAFQAMARWPQDYYTKLRFGIELSPDGSKKVDQFADPEDFEVVMGIYMAVVWKQKYLKGETRP